MIDLIIIIVFELLFLLLIVGTVWEWWKSRRHVVLLPIVAYVLAMCSLAVPYKENVLLPCGVGFFWLVVGLVVRVIVGRAGKGKPAPEQDPPPAP